jgi:4-hydroxybenzoate polyprenyltransferase
VDVKFKKDYAFWIYLFGLITLSSGLSIFYNDNVFKFVLLGIANVLLILFSLFINRNVFLVFGTIGLTEFLSRLSWKYFEGSMFFPFALTLIGVLLIFSGIFLQKNRKRIEKNIMNKLPELIINLRPKRNL